MAKEHDAVGLFNEGTIALILSSLCYLWLLYFYLGLEKYTNFSA